MAHFRKDTFCGAAAHRREQKHVVRVKRRGSQQQSCQGIAAEHSGEVIPDKAALI